MFHNLAETLNKITMKNLIKKMSIACIALTMLSCSDDDNNSNQPQTIAEIATANPDFSTLVTALNRTGLTSTLDGAGQFTVFAPTNSAFTTFFASLGANVNVNNVDVNVLRSILLNHVIDSEILSSAIPASTYVTTLSPFSSATNSPRISMFVQKSGAFVTLNGGIDSKGAVVTTADVDASNGVIHIVNRVIQIPTLVDHVVDNPEFETLQTVVTSVDQAAVLTALSGLTASAPATLFAPNNAAFTTALGTGGFANGATAAQVTKVLQYHVTTAGNVRSTQLTNNQVVPMFTNPVQNTTVILGTNTVDIRDTANNLSRVFQADIQASNGVIHGVNRVLQPAL
ncbi:putative surface protein with fasciclin (FAS1) repeats [Flavobacterium sp. 102]|nr:putative surface protein with fasciclin (FAS1) repeats [Flavobacterium sp. 102]